MSVATPEETAAFRITPLGEEHVCDLAKMERLVFPAEPWSEESLRLLYRENGFGAVAVVDGRAVGYGGMTYAGDEGSVTNIAVHPAFRRRGIGRALTAALLEKSRSLCLSSLWLEVRPSNTAAIALYESLGFTLAGRRRHFYRAPTEDALLYRRCLSL